MLRRSLKLRFALMVAVVYLAVAALSFAAFRLATASVARTLGTRFAAKQALLERSRLLFRLEGDLAVSLELGRSPLLRRWAEHEDDRGLRALALAELESYRQRFNAGACFFVTAKSRHYWYFDGQGIPSAPRYVLEPSSPKDSWYFATLRDVQRYAFNVNHDEALGVTKLWINVVARDGEKVLGVGGSGLDITRFLDELVRDTDPGVTTILFDRDGVIEGHPDPTYVAHNSRARGTEKKVRIDDLLDGPADREALRAATLAVTSGGRDAETLHVGLEGKRRLAAVSSLAELGWLNLVLVDEASVVDNRTFLPATLVTVVSLLVLVLTLGVLLNRTVLARLARLSQAATELARGNYDVQTPASGDDEIGELTGAFNEMTRRVREYKDTLEQKVQDRTAELDRSNRALSDSNRRLTDSIAYARLIQGSILPDDDSLARALHDPFVLYRPRDVVGGDFYWCRQTRDGVVLAVVDCTGHGVPGAFMTMTASAVLGRVVDTVGPDPGPLLAELDHRLRAEIPVADAERGLDHGLDIGVCWLPAARDRLVFGGAGLELHIVVKGGVRVLRGDRQPVGYRSGDPDRPRPSQSIELEPGALYVLTTDGLLDQAGGRHGHGFGRQRLAELLVRVAAAPPAERGQLVASAIADWQGSRAQRDDITVLGFELEPRGKDRA